jgi:hypothetical protein
MRLLARAAVGGALAISLLGCTRAFGRQYEYEEQYFLAVDGSATVVMDASIPALVALHGLPLDPKPLALTNMTEIRRVFEQAGCQVTQVGNPWRRDGRRFIQVTLRVDDVRKAAACAPLGWATYAFGPFEGGLLRYKAMVGAPAGGDPGAVNWNGSELVAFKLHLPSKIDWQNVKRLEDGSNGSTERGNILTWEQRLADRRAGQPVDIEARIEPESILYRTLLLFGGAFVAAVIVLLVAVLWVVRHGRTQARAARAAGQAPPPIRRS